MGSHRRLAVLPVDAVSDGAEGLTAGLFHGESGTEQGLVMRSGPKLAGKIASRGSGGGRRVAAWQGGQHTLVGPVLGAEGELPMQGRAGRAGWRGPRGASNQIVVCQSQAGCWRCCWLTNPRHTCAA
jgi:hypothetical protein